MQITPPLSIELRPLDALIPFARNARMHPEAQIARIAASIAEFGFNNPILVDGANGIIAGHGRLAAARKLGMSEVPVIELGHLSPTQKRAYILNDNRTAEAAAWDQELLALELAELSEAGFDLDLTGFDANEVEELLDRLEAERDADEDPDPPPGGSDDEGIPEAPAEPVTRPGDLWILGEHRLICADAVDRDAIARLMAGDTAQLLFTSPPYANQRDYTTGGVTDWDRLMQGVFGAAFEAMAPNGQMLVNLGLVHREGSVQRYWDDWITWMPRQGWRFFGWYVWDQSVTVPGDWAGRLAPRHEFLFHFNREARKPNKTVPCKWAGHETHLRADGSSTAMRAKDGSIGAWCHAGAPTQDFRIPDSVIEVTRQRGGIGKEKGDGIDHPAVFPVGLPRFVIEAYTDPGEIVFEPFSGSGTLILAAQLTGRKARAVELAPEYVDVAVRRWLQHHPDIEPVLEATGQTWNAVAAERLPEEIEP